MRERTSVRVISVALLVVMATVAWPDAGEAARNSGARGWVLRVSSTWIEPDRGGLVVGYDGRTVRGSEPWDVGLSVGGEYRLSPRVGWEVGVLATSNTAGVRARDGVVIAAGTSSYGSLTLGPDIHLTPGRAADLFVGPFLAYTARTDVGYQHDEWAGIRVGGRFGWGLVLGLDVPVGERGWRVCTSVRHIETNLEATAGNGDRLDVEYGPTALGIGFGYRF